MLKTHKLCRIGTGLLLVIISVSCRYGRILQRNFEGLVPYIPHLGALIIIAGGFGFSAYVLRQRQARHSEIIQPLGKTVVQLLGITALAILFPVALTKWFVQFDIETVHLIKYTLLALLISGSIQKASAAKRAIAAAVLTGLVGTAEETLQIWVPERFFDPRDILLNLLAACFGAFLSWLLSAWLRALYPGQA